MNIEAFNINEHSVDVYINIVTTTVMIIFKSRSYRSFSIVCVRHLHLNGE